MTKAVHVIIDGLRPDAIAQAACPGLKALMHRGAFSLTARSVMPTLTLPCHVSIFHSVTPERHGILDNDWHSMAQPLPGLVEVLKEAGLRCAFFTNWDPLRNLCQPNQLAMMYCYNTSETDPMSDHRIADQAAHYLQHDSFDYSFVYFGSLDTVGHWYGWMSDAYIKHIEEVDRCLQIVVQAVPEDSVILLHSDHGGHDHKHGTDSDEDMLIPWMIAGTNIRKNHHIQSEVSLLNAAPTIAACLGVAPAVEWQGSPVSEIFVAREMTMRHP